MNEEIIKNEIQKGMAQVDNTLMLNSFAATFDPLTRKVSVYFTAKTENGETVEVSTKMG